MKKIIAFGLTMLVVSSEVAVAASSSVITLHYNPRLPYTYLANGQVVGFLADPVVNAFNLAGVPFIWRNTPSKRQFSLIEANRGLDCLVGRYKKPDREAYARFSASFYQDRPHVAVGLQTKPLLHQINSLKDLVQNSSLRFLVKDSYSYGPQIDEWINARASAPRYSTGENISMLREVFYGQADFMLLGQEEAEALIEHSGLPKGKLKIYVFPDAPAGEKRYLMCSKQVPQAVIDRVNQYLPAVKAK